MNSGMTASCSYTGAGTAASTNALTSIDTSAPVHQRKTTPFSLGSSTGLPFFSAFRFGPPTSRGDQRAVCKCTRPILFVGFWVLKDAGLSTLNKPCPGAWAAIWVYPFPPSPHKRQQKQHQRDQQQEEESQHATTATAPTRKKIITTVTRTTPMKGATPAAPATPPPRPPPPPPTTTRTVPKPAAVPKMLLLDLFSL